MTVEDWSEHCPIHFVSSNVRLSTGSEDGAPILSGLPESASAAEDPREVGIFLSFHAERPSARHVFTVGRVPGLHRFTAHHRYEPFWMKAAAGSRAGEIPIETQFLLVEREDGLAVVFVPLLDGAFRCCLQGAEEDSLELVVESGDPATMGEGVTGLFVAVGRDAYSLLEAAALSIGAWMKTGRLRREKPLPSFVDCFGWCTWDAFYQDVSEEKVREGLESFRKGGVQPRVSILDDGWQSEEKLQTGERRLTGFQPNQKFQGDLGPTVQLAKTDFGIETFLVWHAMTGYWGGVDGERLPGYGVRTVARTLSPGIAHYVPTMNDWWGPTIGLVAPEHSYRFFHDYHRSLRLQGVDGVKVDTQATLEGVASGLGGRVSLMRTYHEALEGSVQTHFLGNLVNCMSCSTEMLYSALNSTLTRTSTDFWPDRPESHGVHLYTNAQVSAWFGEFVHPDWDMFQSGHPMGAYHAAGRAVGGCPVYVSDKPGIHDFSLLRKLVLPDGGILRAKYPGRPTRDCLFHDPTSEEVLLKIFNRNEENGVLGVFNARFSEEGRSKKISGHISPADVDGLFGEKFAVYAHETAETRILGLSDQWEVALPQLGYEVFTIAPVVDGMAPIGLADMFNSGGAVLSCGWDEPGVYEALVAAGGRFLAWSEKPPTRVEVDGALVAFNYNRQDKILELIVPEGGVTVLRLLFES